ncbi:MAG: hypothetical protein Q9209_002046 [Squamulea sp. 1 TL-2023]
METLEVLLAALVPSLSSLVGGLTYCFAGMPLEDLKEQMLTQLQIIYAVLVFFTSHVDVFRLYVGSSYGQQGLRYRIWGNHMNPRYRNRDKKTKSKYLYRCTEIPNAVSWAIPLAIFQTTVDPAVVFLEEAIMASIFGTYPSSVYKKLRDPSLPLVNWEAAVNQSDPLTTSDSQAMWKDSIMSKRRTKLENARAGGPVHASQDPKGYWFCRIFDQVQLSIPVDVSAAWQLTKSKEERINVRYDISVGRHPNVFATKADPSADGSRLGIQLSKEVDGKLQTHWLSRKTVAAIKEANSLYDWISGRIDDDPDERDWGPDRVPLFGAQGYKAMARKRLATKAKLDADASEAVPLLERPSLGEECDESAGKEAVVNTKMNEDQEQDEDRDEGEELTTPGILHDIPHLAGWKPVNCSCAFLTAEKEVTVKRKRVEDNDDDDEDEGAGYDIHQGRQRAARRGR